MNDDIRIRFRWTVDELLTGYRWYFHQRVRPLVRWAIWLISLVFTAAGAFALWQSRSPSHGALLLCAGLYFPTLFWVIHPWRIRRQFTKRPDRDTEIEWQISGERIHVQNRNGFSDFAWTAIVRVVETPEGFLFYSTHEIFHWLPKQGFVNDSEFERLSHLSQQNAPEFRRVV